MGPPKCTGSEMRASRSTLRASRSFSVQAKSCAAMHAAQQAAMQLSPFAVSMQLLVSICSQHAASGRSCGRRTRLVLDARTGHARQALQLNGAHAAAALSQSMQAAADRGRQQTGAGAEKQGKCLVEHTQGH